MKKTCKIVAWKYLQNFAGLPHGDIPRWTAVLQTQLVPHRPRAGPDDTQGQGSQEIKQIILNDLDFSDISWRKASENRGWPTITELNQIVKFHKHTHIGSNVGSNLQCVELLPAAHRWTSTTWSGATTSKSTDRLQRRDLLRTSISTTGSFSSTLRWTPDQTSSSSSSS